MEKRGKGNLKIVLFLLFAVEAFYLINSVLNFVALPKFISSLNRELTVLGGIIVLIAGFLIVSKKNKRRYRED